MEEGGGGGKRAATIENEQRVLVFDGGDMVEVQTSSHHREWACACSFSMVEVANKQRSSKPSTRVLIFDGGEVVVANKWRGQRLLDVKK